MPELDPDVSRSLGGVVAKDVVDWLDATFVRRTGESFGKFPDQGVVHTMRVLRERGFTLTNVPTGPDQAEIALNNRSDKLVAQFGRGHMTLGGEDHKVLDHAFDRNESNPGAWVYHVVVPDETTDQIPKLAPDGQYKGIFPWTSLKAIRRSRLDLRRTDEAERRRHRTFVSRHFHQRFAEITPLPAKRLVSTVLAIASLGPDPAPSPDDGDWAISKLAQALEGGGLTREAVNALLLWSLEHADVVTRDAPDRSRELLVRAAIAVAVDGWINHEAADVIRVYASRNAPELLTPFERAIAELLLPHS
ncbi:hypothetical protein [Microbacterium sp. P5_E9]